MPTSKLFWNAENQQLEVETVNSKKVVKRRVCPIDQLASDIPRQVSETDNIEVDFDTDQYGNILRIRLKGGQTMSKEYYQELEIQKAQEAEATANSQPRQQGDFHNPYNFVPASPRSEVNKADKDGNISDLGDKPPRGHDCYISDMFSGKLNVKMIAVTPLIVLDTARMTINANDAKHKEFPVRIENEKPYIEPTAINGKPYIEPTAIKGMVRSAFEAITNSRMSVFGESDRLAFRMEADTKFVYPALVIKKGGNAQVKLLVETYTNNNGRQIENKQIAKLELYEKEWNGIDNNKGKGIKTYSQTPQHYIDNKKQQVWVKCHYDNNSRSHIVDEVDTTSGPTGDWKKGWVYISGSNMKDKKYERVFLEYASGKSFSLGNLEKDWEDLISNYQKIHEKEIEKRKPNKPEDYLGNDPGETSWSRQIYDTDYLKLEDGTLCYAFYNGKEIEALMPVMISRRIHSKTPVSMLPQELQPVKNINELSPADRVFGCVIQNPQDKKKTNAYRGQIRFGEVKTDRTDAIQEFDNLPLNILGQPKPQQGRFYVARDKQGNAQVDGLNNENAGYNLPIVKGLRGRKIYPHHAHIEGNEFWFQSPSVNFDEQSNHWNKEFTASSGKKYFREYLRPRKDNKQQRDSQNRSIEGWVKPNTEFTFDIHFTNLSEVELGALIWLLKLPDEHFHRFGGGKPFGFGSVKLELDETQSDIRTGKELAEQRYNSLDCDTPKCENVKSNFVEKFVTAYQSAGYENIIEAFKSACKGFDDKLPIHYPRNQKTPNAEGKNFDWFVANNKNDGRKLSLPDLSNEIGLPIEPTN